MEFQYRGLQAQFDRHLVTQEEMEHQLQRLLQTPRVKAVTGRPTQRGDEVLLDYAGFCKGQQFQGGTAQKQTLVLGSGTFIPGFEDQLLDKMPGEQVSVFVTFPDPYHSAELAGQEAEFKCVIHEIRERSGYQLDDDFAKEVGGCDTLEEFRARLTESMQQYADQRGEMDLQDRLLRQAAATLELTIPEEEMEKAVEAQLENLKAQLAQQGLSLEMYCQFMSTDEKTIRQELRPEAESRIRTQAAVEKIVALEQLEATQEEVAQALAVICRQNNMTMEELQPHYDDAFAAMVVNTILTGKVMELIRRAAVVEEV